MTIPYEILTQTTYNTWKIDFAINCPGMTSQGDKEYAMYIEFQDTAGTTFNSFLFNLTTPYTIYKNASTFSNSTYSNIENYILTDYIDFSGFSGSDLTIHFYRYGDSSCITDFSWLLSLSKNNLV
jgi:hypothetical protein